MKVFTKIADLKQFLAQREGTVGFVPTMGALHNGHASLVKRSASECDTTIVSVFVNPTQFNNPNDLRSYPRSPEKDIQLLEACDATAVFMPTVEEVYPTPDTRVFALGTVAEVMEGAQRPGHFNGVAQVVSRLFEIVAPTKAFFGEKDFQQIAVIREMVRQLNFPLEIVSCPIVREADGLALSSRNRLLNPTQRQAAPRIAQTLREAQKQMNQLDVATLKAWITRQINTNSELCVEYVAIVNEKTLLPVNTWEESGPKYVCIAVQVGQVRLIDNLKLV